MIRPLLGRPLIEHRLREVHDRLRRAREELAIIDEQLISLEETAEDARIRSLVSETPLAERDWIEAQRHADAPGGRKRRRLRSLANWKSAETSC
ncbi:MAG: hypothetical protein M1115_11200 [Actinobacteria bacterium]|nr:hypothetical protein [Actinomycetota bacterium]